MTSKKEYNIFKDSVIYAGRITAFWRCSAAKAGKYYNGSNMVKVPAKTFHATLETVCGKTITFNTYTMGFGDVSTVPSPWKLGLQNLSDEHRNTNLFFWKWESHMAEQEIITVRLANVWFPKDNPNRGYATAMPQDELNPEVRYIDFTDVEGLADMTASQMRFSTDKVGTTVGASKVTRDAVNANCCSACREASGGTDREQNYTERYDRQVGNTVDRIHKAKTLAQLEKPAGSRVVYYS